MSFTARPLGSSPTPPVNSLKRKIEQERLRGKDKKKRAKGEPSRPAAAGTYDNAAPSSVESYKEDVPASGPLPIAALRLELVAAVKAHATTIVVGETGSGKSTKLAQYLADALLPRGSGCIVCTQPRRVAAVTIAQRVAAERRGRVGDEVGYSIRFEDKTSKRTRIKFVTDGVLVRECMGDQDLKGYTVVILDEAHERSLQTDILMGLLRQLQDRRADLRLVVMSATLQVDLFMGYFKVGRRVEEKRVIAPHSAPPHLLAALAHVEPAPGDDPWTPVPRQRAVHAAARARLHRRGYACVPAGALDASFDNALTGGIDSHTLTSTPSARDPRADPRGRGGRRSARVPAWARRHRGAAGPAGREPALRRRPRQPSHARRRQGGRARRPHLREAATHKGHFEGL